MKTIISLFDYSGSWSQPYLEAGYCVIRVDLKLGVDIMTFDYKGLNQVHGILAAPPCTEFASSGAQYWNRKDADGTTAKSLQLIDKTLEIIAYHQPQFWALENPVGRLGKLRLGKPALIFEPYFYGDPYTKKSCLWGEFCVDLPKSPVEPIQACAQGSWIQKLGGKSERTKELRSITPTGFARAFFIANP